MSIDLKVTSQAPSGAPPPLLRTWNEPTVFVHPSAICESAMVGDSTRVWAFAHIMDGVEVGRNCNIGDHAFLETGVHVGDRVTIKNGAMLFAGLTIEDDAFIGPGVIFTNDRYPRSPRMSEAAGRYKQTGNWLTPTVVRKRAAIGAGAVILPGVTIGACATVGAAAVVTRDVADHRVVVGNPARVAGWVCHCGLRLTSAWVCTGCQRRYRQVDDRLSAIE